MFRRDNNGRAALNRTILDRAIRYRIGLCDDSDPRCSCYHLRQRFPSREALTRTEDIFRASGPGERERERERKTKRIYGRISFVHALRTFPRVYARIARSPLHENSIVFPNSGGNIVAARGVTH